MACAWVELLVKKRTSLVAGWLLFVKIPTSDQRRATSDKFRLLINEERLLPPQQRATSNERQFSGGFTLLALVGILAIMTIVASVLLPNMVTLQNQQATNAERVNLKGIAQGSDLYLRRNLAWPPNLAAHSPEYVTLDSAQLLQNPRGYLRYFQIHPDTVGFSNQTGLASSDLPNARFLLISDLTQDAAPIITNATEFDTWWGTATTPDLYIYKGNMAHLFHEVNLSGAGDGGSYQIDSATTNSGGATLSNYTRYHVRGTVVALDESPTFGSPELQFTLTTNVSYVFVPCYPIGEKWKVPPPPTCPVLWLTTRGNANGTPGLSSWNDAQLVALVDPNLAYEPGPSGTTAGTFGLSFDLENFTKDADIDAIHYVTQPITVGSTNTIALAVGDLLLSTERDETLSSTNSLFVKDEDVFVFKPDIPTDYSSGKFFMVIDGSDLNDLDLKDIRGVSLVEQDTVVGDTILQPGTFLLADENLNEDLYQFIPTSVGTTTKGTESLFLQGQDIHISQDFFGIHLIQRTTKLGDIILQAGQILATLKGNDSSVGSNNIPTNHQDIFILNLTTTGSTTSGEATLLFDGSDVGLQSRAENLDGITINGPIYQAFSLSIVNPGFETGDVTGWTKTGDLLDTGGVNQWGAVTSAGAMSTPHGGTYFAGGRATGPIGRGPHMTGLYQRLDLSAYSTPIDLGTATVTIAGFGHGETNQDKAKLRIAFYDAVSGGNQLGSNVDSNEAIQSQTWTALAISNQAVPIGTRSIELLLLGEKVNAGSYLDAGLDDVSALLSYP